jgi:hypothetical protein
MNGGTKGGRRVGFSKVPLTGTGPDAAAAGSQIREEELRELWRGLLLSAFNIFLLWMAPLLVPCPVYHPRIARPGPARPTTLSSFAPPCVQGEYGPRP